MVAATPPASCKSAASAAKDAKPEAAVSAGIDLEANEEEEDHEKKRWNAADAKLRRMCSPKPVSGN